jgi:hypothetical protein
MKKPRALVGQLESRTVIADAYTRYMSDDEALADGTLFELFMAGWDAGQAAKAAASPLERDLIAVLQRIREQVPERIGGEPHVIGCGALYAIDLVFQRPDVAPLLTAPAAGREERKVEYYETLLAAARAVVETATVQTKDLLSDNPQWQFAIPVALMDTLRAAVEAAAGGEE